MSKNKPRYKLLHIHGNDRLFQSVILLISNKLPYTHIWLYLRSYVNTVAKHQMRKVKYTHHDNKRRKMQVVSTRKHSLHIWKCSTKLLNARIWTALCILKFLQFGVKSIFKHKFIAAIPYDYMYPTVSVLWEVNYAKTVSKALFMVRMKRSCKYKLFTAVIM